MLRLRRATADDRGAVAVITALVSVVLFGAAALAVDLGSMYQRRRATQTTADLAALAGAASLPDAAAARAVARDYVGRNLAPGGPLPAAGWDDDNDLSNGEIDITNGNTRVKVVVPRRTVDFGLAGAIGVYSSSVSASATAEIRSPAFGVLPFFVTEPEAARSYVCLKDKPNGQAKNTPDAYCTVQTGDFGWLDIPRAGSTGQQSIDANLALGADHRLAAFPPAQLPPIDGTCRASTPGAVHDGVGVDGANCVDVATGNKVSFATNGLLDSAGDGVDGRLADPRAGHATGSIGSFSGVDDDSFASFLNVPLPVFLANVGNPVAGSLDEAVLDCPRFAVVPVLHTSVNPPNGRYAISGFRAVFLDRIDMNGGGTQVVGVNAYSFPLDALPTVLASDKFTNTTPYVGFGPRVPALVE